MALRICASCWRLQPAWRGALAWCWVGAALVCRLASIESFGVAYLTPFASDAGEQMEGHAVLRQPLPRAKLRERFLNTQNRRNQG